MCLLYRAIYPVHVVRIKMAAMLQIPRVFPRVSCLGSAKVVQCPRPGPKIGNKSQQIPRYSPVCPRGQPPGMAADKCITPLDVSIGDHWVRKKDGDCRVYHNTLRTKLSRLVI